MPIIGRKGTQIYDFFSIFASRLRKRDKMKPQFLISSIAAGNGKTFFAMGLLRALKRRGLKVQPYKCGPDFIDAQQLSIASDCETVNLDAWMSTHTHLQHLYNKYGEQADVCITEGTSGLFDGYRRIQGSSAEISKLLNIPIILLINARNAGYSIVPIIYGFKNFYPGVQIAGIVFNQVASPNQYAFLREACSDANVDCLGYVPMIDTIKFPSRHSVLSLTSRRVLEEQADMIAEQMEKTMDINRLLNKCNRTFPCQYTLPYCSDGEPEPLTNHTRKLKIAIARDAAFSFTYRANIDRLAQIGEITHFSPLYGNELPKADMIYLPGGYPELFARQLHRRYKMLESIKEYAEKGGKIWAECGGMAFLGRTMKSRENGTAYPMCNVLPIDFTVSSLPRPIAGYRKLTYSSMNMKGYEYHYSNILKDDFSTEDNKLISNLKGTEKLLPIYRYKNVIASYAHWYWGDRDIMKLWE